MSDSNQIKLVRQKLPALGSTQTPFHANHSITATTLTDLFRHINIDYEVTHMITQGLIANRGIMKKLGLTALWGQEPSCGLKNKKISTQQYVVK